ncbi:MAG: 23S rRNA (adenine(2503)-C(2))-methyltransferase RlmN [Bdellovibrionales bacterium]
MGLCLAGITDPQLILNLSKKFREEIPQLFTFKLPRVIKHLSSTDGTQKFLFDMGDGQSIETVLIPSAERNTLCVSSEVGCNMACTFCYTGKQKLLKRLSVSQIIGQFLQVKSALPDRNITNIVFMGMGEPLDNPKAVFASIDILNNTWGINLSRKKITVSTSGLVDRIPLVSASGARLAVSLNGSNDRIRTEVMPINKKWNIQKLMQACQEHYDVTRDKITFEYVLLAGVTDSLDNARELYQMTKNVPCKLNIIPFNEHPASGYQRPSEEKIDRFQQELIRLGAHVLRRKTMGRDIFAACGQLNSTASNHPETMPS